MSEEVKNVESLDEEAEALEPKTEPKGDEVIIDDPKMFTECQLFTNEAIRLQKMLDAGLMVQPEMEGFFSRLFYSFFNWLPGTRNRLMGAYQAIKALVTGDWLAQAERAIEYINDHMPSDEIFQQKAVITGGGPIHYGSGTIPVMSFRRCTKGEAMKYRACLETVAKYLQTFEKDVMSSEPSMYTRGIQQIVAYLQLNKCKVDLARPSKSKAATRVTYGEHGRLGTMGYGGSVRIFLNGMEENLRVYKKVFDIITDTNGLNNRLNQLEAQINKMEVESRTIDENDRRATQLVERINNLKARLVAVQSIARTIGDFWRVTFVVSTINPLSMLCDVAGMESDLTSWIFATEKNEW